MAAKRANYRRSKVCECGRDKSLTSEGCERGLWLDGNVRIRGGVFDTVAVLRSLGGCAPTEAVQMEMGDRLYNTTYYRLLRLSRTGRILLVKGEMGTRYKLDNNASVTHWALPEYCAGPKWGDVR